MAEFFAMGGYAQFLWPSYALALLALLVALTMIDGNILKQKSTDQYLDLENALKDRLFADTSYRI